MALDLCRIVVRGIVVVAVALADRQTVVVRLDATLRLAENVDAAQRLVGCEQTAPLLKHPATRVVHLDQQRVAPPSASPT
jgi:hypothetical protein